MAPNAVEKALQVLLAFQEEHPTWGVRELGSHLGFSPATVQRLLQTLRAYGFIEQDAGSRQYRLGTIYFQFVGTLQAGWPLARIAVPVLEQLVDATGETAHLNRMEGEFRICVASVESRRSLKAGMPVGNRSPLYAGASSKCLLAFSPDGFRERYLASAQFRVLTAATLPDAGALARELRAVRKQGYASSLGERTPGLGSLSVPVFDPNGELLAAVSLAIPELRFQDSCHRARCLQALLVRGQELSWRMGYRGAYRVAAEPSEA